MLGQKSPFNERHSKAHLQKTYYLVITVISFSLRNIRLCDIISLLHRLFSHNRKGVQQMGKNLKGKECGKGICQRKDGQCCARFADKSGKQRGGYFATRPEARNWLEDARYQDKHAKSIISSNMTVNEWFEFWHTELLRGYHLIPSAIIKSAMSIILKPFWEICDLLMLSLCTVKLY